MTKTGYLQYIDESGNKEILESGKLYLFPSLKAYQLYSSERDPLVCTFIHMDMLPFAVDRLTQINPENDSALNSLMLTFFHAIDKKYSSVVDSLASTFEAYCIELGIFETCNSQVSAVIQYIASHFNEVIRIGQLSSMCRYSEQYFIRVLKKFTVTTPYQYIINYRLNKSELLLRGNDSIETIAEKIGFKDAKTFCRLFAKRYGTPPGRFRYKRFTLIP